DTVDIRVSTIGGTSPLTAADRFDYTPTASPFTPTVTSVTPNFGSPSGGAAVTITGTNFNTATDVAFGGTLVTGFTIVSDTAITTTAPPGTDTVDVAVTNPDGTSAANAADQFSYGPLITRVSPVDGSGGGNTKVTISGHNFRGAGGVTFGGIEALTF